jgi:hypothetical protein
MECKFYIERGRWYFRKKEMISGADTLLDYISDGDKQITLEIKETPFKNASQLKYQSMAELKEGAYYYIEYYEDIRKDIIEWLSDDFIFLFGYETFPTYFYFKKI